MQLDYWFDAQFRTYILQVSAVFTGFQYSALDSDGNPYLTAVPVMWAAPDRQVAVILNNNSENAALSAPRISVWVAGLDMDDDRRRQPNGVDVRQVFERAIDPVTGDYTSELGNTYTIERFMPVPYKMKFQIDIWTTNKLQKDQLLEQILVLFNPGLDIQTSTNPLDWTAITTLRLTGITYSSQSIPIGATSEIDIATLEFELPVFLNPPAKVKKQNIINQIVANIGERSLMPRIDSGDIPQGHAGTGSFWSEKDLYTRIIVSPGDYSINVCGKEITLLSSGGLEYDSNGVMLDWKTALSSYGEIRPSISQIRLKTNDCLDDSSGDLVGTIQIHPRKKNVLIWTIDADTLKSNNLPNINAIITPSKCAPGIGLPIATNGQRYLLDGDCIKENGWNGLEAYTGDIIEYNTNQWYRTFIAKNNAGTYYVTNSYTGVQLKWDNIDFEWVLSIDGLYNSGYWRIFL